MRVGVLGPLEVDGGTTRLGPRDRVVLQALAVRPGTVVRPEAIAEALWGEELPASWAKVVQGCIVRLRKALGPDAIDTSPQGYRLLAHVDHLDHLRFEHLLARARGLLAEDEPERASFLLNEALGLWRGDPFADLGEWGAGRVEAERLVELRRDAEDLHTEASLRRGRYEEALGSAYRLVQDAPFRERRWGLLALAQYQLGRQGDALRTLQRARAVLVSELGLDPGPDLASLEQSILQQDPDLVAQVVLREPSLTCPYLGLMAYDVDDAPAYFGRETDIVACLRRLDTSGVLAIAGPSGSGKSSLARAGVASALLRDGTRVRVITPGKRPMDALSGIPAGTVLVVDQCEEALALDESSPERAAFFAALAEASASAGLVVTIRADRLGEISLHPDFARVVERGLYFLGPIGPEDLRRAIEGPAAQAGLRLEPGLVDLLVREVEGEPGGLPLLSHVLRQTWERREGGTLTVSAYAATGGIREAVAQSAERLYRELTPAQQEMLRGLMLRLVAPDDAGNPTRVRVPRRSVAVDETSAEVLERLVGARLVSSDDQAVEIAHESLALAWPRLRSWLDDDIDGLRIMRHLAIAADSWAAMGRPDSELYRGARQASAAEWQQRAHPSLTDAEREFLAASSALADKEARATQEQVRRERRSNQRLRAGLAAIAALLAVAIIAGALAYTSAARADQQATRAEEQARAADARRVGAEALRTPALDRALLLAVLGTRLDDSADTETNLAAVLDRAPQVVSATQSLGATSLSIRPDGRALAAGGVFTGLTIFDTTTLAEVARNFDVPVRRVEYNPNGRQLVASVNPWSPTGERRVDPVPLRVLDPKTARLSGPQPGGVPRGRVVHESFAFSGDGRWLAAGFIHPKQLDEDTWVRVWDSANLARPVAAFTLPFIAYRVAISDDGGRLHITSPEPLVRTVEVATGKVVASASVTDPVQLALSPNGSTLAVVRDTQVALLDPTRLTVKEVLDEGGEVSDVGFSANGNQLTYAVDGTAVARPLNGEGEDARFHVGGEGQEVTAVRISTDGRTLYSASDLNGLLAWDVLGDRRFVRKLPISKPPDAEVTHVQISPDGRTAGYLITDGQESFAVQLLNVKTGRRTPPSPFRHTPTYYVDLAWRRDSKVAASVQGDQWVDFWDRTTAQRLSRYQAPASQGVLHKVTFSGDGSRVVLGTDSGWVHTIDTSSLRPAGPPIRVKPGSPVDGAAVNRDGSRAVVNAGGTIQLLDLRAGRVLRTVDPGFVVSALEWSPDGTFVVVVGADYTRDEPATVAVVDPATLATRMRASGAHTGGNGYLIQFSPGGDRFLTAGGGQVGLWDSSTLGLTASVHDEEGGPSGATTSGMAFTGTTGVLLASPAGTVSEWNPDPAAARAAACRIVPRDLTEEEWRTYLPERRKESVCPG
ncbi:MAG TPA: BTAD domain-containing putative transcriptional regulator [Dermatophilaceae bacterium]|nr:BTAD domain-containing putative transcriptional regulator [Dermatophilaceae bacterium]